MNVKCTFLLVIMLIGGFMAHDVNAGDAAQRARAVTLWWLFFNHPDGCVTNPGAPEQCGELDVFGRAYLDSVALGTPDPSLISPNPEARLGVVYATGGLTDAHGRIRLVASAYKSAGDRPLSLGPGLVDPLGLGRALQNPDAEIHLVVRDHGRKVRGHVTEQIGNFLDPYCSDPLLLFHSGPNACRDVQFAVFGPTETGSDAVFEFGNPPQQVHRATAQLIRNGDMVQAIVATRIKAGRTHRNQQ